MPYVKLTALNLIVWILLVQNWDSKIQFDLEGMMIPKNEIKSYWFMFLTLTMALGSYLSIRDFWNSKLKSLVFFGLNFTPIIFPGIVFFISAQI